MARQARRNVRKTDEEYLGVAEGYVRGVLSGDIPACKWIRLSCERQLKDLDRQGDSDFGFTFDPAKGARVCRFVELLPHIKGDDAKGSGRITLSPWQVFMLMTVFGWVDENGKRRFRIVYVEVPRKNGKSTFSAAVALYMLVADGEEGPEVYSAATHREQAMIVWNDAVRMVEKTPDLKKMGVEVNRRAIARPSKAATFLPIARDRGGNLDGANSHFVVIDELHAHKTSALYDVMETSLAARSQPLLWSITTAGFNRAGVCFEKRTYLTRVLDGQYTDENFFGLIYTIDDDDDPFDEKSWVKANPNFGVSVRTEVFAQVAHSARQMPSNLNNFLTKHLNVWVSSSSAWMDMREFLKCANPDLKEEDFKKERCFLSVDLASRSDICSTCRLYWRDVDGRRNYYAFFDYYVPERKTQNADQYSTWEQLGLFKLSPYEDVDFTQVEEDIIDHCKTKRVLKVLLDPWNAQQMHQSLNKSGAKSEMVDQSSARVFSEAMKEFEAAVNSGRFHYNGDPIFEWCVSNVMSKEDDRGNIRPVKERPENKIDPVDALLIAMKKTMEDIAPPASGKVFFI